jgi:transcriptional regulator with XRE-family HTH domain
MTPANSDHGYIARRFADNLLRLREQADVSQEQLGFMASLHRTEIGGLERGHRVPKLDTILKLAGALSVEPGELLKGMEWSSPPDSPQRGGFRVSDALGHDVAPG